MKKWKLKNKEQENMKVKTPWTDFYGDVPEHLEYSEGTIYDYFEENSLKRPNLVAYEYYGTKVTFREFTKKVIEAAKAFKAIGVKENDCVTVCMANTPQGIISFYALNMIGAISNMIHPLSGEKEIEFYVKKGKSNVIIVIDVAYEKVMNILPDTNLEHIIVAPVADDMSLITKTLYQMTLGRKSKVKNKTSEVIMWKDFIKNGAAYTGKYRIAKDKNDPAVILYSGGTTGTPKGILLSNLNFNSIALGSHKMCDPSDEGDSILAILPIFHSFGLAICVHTALCIGMKLHLIPSFKPQNFASLVKKYRPSFIAGVPTLYETFLKAKDIQKDDLSYLRCLLSGGDTLSPNLKREIDNFLKERGSKAEIRSGYGLTECCGATAVVPSNQYRDNSVGIPFPDAYYKIVKIGTHEEVPYNEDGEICISGPSVMLGYLDNEDETAQTLRLHDDNRLWLHTGDVGSMDENGFVYFRQRIKRIIISSGYNIYPSYVETVINNHPAVSTCTVVGIPHKYKVQVAKAFIVLRETYTLTEELKKEIYEHCEKNIAKYSIPYEFEYRESLPKTILGKIAYNKLIEEEQEKQK